MAYHVYANLAPMGWTEITKDSIMSSNGYDPATWIFDGGHLDSSSTGILPEKFVSYPFVHISYGNKDYRVSPFQIQIVTD